MARVIDISQPLGTRTAVWPGDRPVEIGWTMRRERGDAVNVAELMTSVHAGTHVDGPRHFGDGGATPADLPLDAYVGPAIVVDAVGRTAIDASVMPNLPLAGARLLFHTRARVDATEFPDPFAAFDADFARRLADAGVRLVGTDAPSVDPFDSKTLDAHHAFAARDVAILENLVLDGVNAGTYILVAAPLKLVEADSASTRAILIEGLAWTDG